MLDGSELAVVGMAGRFPGAPELDRFWHNLRDGVESIRFVCADEFLARGAEPCLLADPAWVRAVADLEGADRFDAGFFGFSPREAEILDPQQRLFLECSWEALESAGCDPAAFPGLIAVFASATTSTYLVFHLLANAGVRGSVDPVQLLVANAADSLATRVSYKLDLKGPSFSVQSACSSSLVAVHLACQSLLQAECDLALAGGVSVNVRNRFGYRYDPGSILSPDGHCRAFDERAAGTVFGSGAGVVVLKRATDAVEQGDPILALIRGTAVNNDGSLKVGYTAPAVEGQAEVIAEALGAAGVEADSIGYVEAHGTGTSLGDPIEVQALTRAFRGSTRRRGFCALGSVKTNIGHLDVAAGVAGLIKTVLALRNRQIPPSLHFERPNPKIDFASSPVFVNAELRDWPRGPAPRRAGVSSFGFGGTNAHVVLEEAPEPVPSDPPARPWQLLVLSARTATALDAATDHLAAWLREHPDTEPAELADIAWTLQTGRRVFPHRRALVCRSVEEALRALDPLDPERVAAAAEAPEPDDLPVAFLFPGQGAQHPDMARELYEGEPLFRREIDGHAERLRPLLGLNLQEVLFPQPGEEESVAEWLTRTDLAQAALFTVEHALARLWIAWGISPAAMLGHSIGEYVAACLAGVFTLEEALALVAARGRLMAETPPGAMTGVPLSEAEIRPLLDRFGRLALAAVNEPSRCVVAGPTEAVEELERELAARDVPARRLHTSHAFHSPMMDPVLERFGAEVRRIRLRPPQIPFVSNVTGTWITPAEATDPGYWVRHLRQTVRFADGVSELARKAGLLLEVGPGRTLATMARRHPALAGRTVASSLPGPRERGDFQALLGALGRLWLAGRRIGWAAVHGGGRRRRVPLPTYPFEGERYWIEPSTRPGIEPSNQPEEHSAPAETAVPPPRTRPERRVDPGEWLYHPSWKMAPRPAFVPGSRPPRRWLALPGGGDLGEALIARLRAAGEEVIAARAGSAYGRAEDGSWVLDVRSPEPYERLLRDLTVLGREPQGVLWLGALAPATGNDGGTRFTAAQEDGLLGLLRLGRALAATSSGGGCEVVAMTSGAFGLGEGEPAEPGRTTLLAACKVLPQEVPGLTCRAVDVELPRSAPERERLAARLAAEVLAGTAPVTAWRTGRRWVQSCEPLNVPLLPVGSGGEMGEGPEVRTSGLYLISGPLRGAARALAAYLEALGARIVPLPAQLQDAEALRRAIADAEGLFGTVAGLIHASGIDESDLRPVASLDLAEAGRRLRDEAAALAALDEALQGRGVGFRVLCSSLAGVLGGPGSVLSAAAALVLDSFAVRSAEAGWISLGWDVWRREGTEEGIGDQEGVEVLRRVLAGATVPQVAVSPIDLQARLDRWIGGSEAAMVAVSLALHPRPALATPYAAPASDLERAIAAVWGGILGIDRVGAHDNFFDLGGDSFIAVQAINRLGRELGREIPVTSLYEGLTVASLARLIEREAAPPAEAGQVQVLEESRDRRKQAQSRLRARSKDVEALLVAQVQEGEG